MKIDVQIENKLKLLRLAGMLQTLAVRLKQAEESNNGIKRHTAADLLIIDDFGLKPMTPVQSDDLYEVINDRYMKKAIIFDQQQRYRGLAGVIP